MKKIIIVNGLIAGVIVGAMFYISLPLIQRGIIDFDYGMLVGYASMVIGLSIIFFGIKTYRDQYQGGTISFGQGFKIGILIALIASVVYVAAWEVYYQAFATDFMEQYTNHALEKMKENGATAAAIEATREQMNRDAALYDNYIIVRFGYTLLEILPVGLIITLISAGILKRQQILPA